MDTDLEVIIIRGNFMNFRIFQCYINVCNFMMFQPSWQGLEGFRLFYLRSGL